SNSNIYCYADSKQALYRDCVSYAISKWQSRVFEAVDGIDDPLEKLNVSFQKAVEYLSQDTVFCDILKSDQTIFPMFPTIDPIEEYNEISINFICDIMKDGIKKGVFQNVDARDTSIVLFNIYKAFIIETYIRQDNPNIDEHEKTIVNLLLYGLLKR
ncbi:MAG: hypothetical protein RSE39_03230, partial [Oscillospiraceae bacterium]